MYNVRTEPDRTEAAGQPLPSTFLALGDILECYERCYMRVPIPLDAIPGCGCAHARSGRVERGEYGELNKRKTKDQATERAID